MTAEALEWDSAWLGVRVVRLDGAIDSVAHLCGLVEQLRSEGTRLVYWISPEPVAESAVAAAGGRLVDVRTTYEAECSGDPESGARSSQVVRAAADMDVGDFERLALQSGAYSRFATDPRIPAGAHALLYRTWIRRCLAGELAREVLVVQRESAVVGMLTLDERAGAAEIGLVAVDAAWRGQGIGADLMRAAADWCRANGLSRSRVVTQAANRPACRLYESCGYSVARIEYVYHCWL